MTAAPAIAVAGLTARHGRSVAVEDATFTVASGELVALVGPNGAGKSTLLRSLLGVHRHDGTARLTGHPGFVPQRAAVDPDFPITVEQVALSGRRRFRRAWRRPSPADRLAAARAVARVGLDGLERRTLGELSGGQAQRALLARALAAEADVLLLDEPLAGVDRATTDSLCDLLHDLAGDGAAVVVATHDLDLVRRRFPRCLALNRRVVSDGPPAPVLGAAGLEALFLTAA
ncbi:MAG: ATP-binding cassette domain-containing protein [Actinomycetota bacterium]